MISRFIGKTIVYGVIPAVLAFGIGYKIGVSENAEQKKQSVVIETYYGLPTVTNPSDSKKYAVDFENKKLTDIDLSELQKKKERKELTDLFTK